MRYRRPPPDHEGLRRVLLLCALLLALAGVGFVIVGVVRGRWGLVAGAALIGFAVACLRVSWDDTSGQWCPECIARNADEASTCASCGSALV